MQKRHPRLTFANVVSCIALFVALGGSAYAATQLKKNSVGAKQLRKNSVTAAKLKKNSVVTAKLKNGAVTGAKVQTATLGTVPSAETAANLVGYSRKGMTRVVASAAGSYEAGLETAPQTPLFTVGPLTLYAQCFLIPTRLEGVISIKTSANNAIVDADGTELSGDPKFLDTDTAPERRELLEQHTSENEAEYYGGENTEFAAMAADATTLAGSGQIAVKYGTLAGGNGIYGEGNVCLFGADVASLGG